MTTSKFGIAIVTAFVVLSTTTVFPQQAGGSHNSHDKQIYPKFVDENGDGLNDNMRHMQQQGMHKRNHAMSDQGMMNGQNHSGMGHQGGGVGMSHQSGMGGCGNMNSSSGVGNTQNPNGGMGRH